MNNKINVTIISEDEVCSQYWSNNRDGTEEQIEILSQRFMIWTLKDTEVFEK